MKSKFLLLAFPCVLASEANGALLVYPAEIIGRDLSVPGFKWLGTLV